MASRRHSMNSVASSEEYDRRNSVLSTATDDLSEEDEPHRSSVEADQPARSSIEGPPARDAVDSPDERRDPVAVEQERKPLGMKAGGKQDAALADSTNVQRTDAQPTKPAAVPAQQPAAEEEEEEERGSGEEKGSWQGEGYTLGASGRKNPIVINSCKEAEARLRALAAAEKRMGLSKTSWEEEVLIRTILLRDLSGTGVLHLRY